MELVRYWMLLQLQGFAKGAAAGCWRGLLVDLNVDDVEVSLRLRAVGEDCRFGRQVTVLWEAEGG